ncbi:hypothetical protein C5Y97_00735 [Blastopirellula marina]|uniref:Uncharacterized protein n=1 Tax=Blastopirellula marina TaxID=124 RepID=A0A2S8GE62_9BACT|nr:hypothetical protein C5Y98_00735 [Blastopirellula marina]PTL46479.1 hypothetical protein C5Y97_00735 [Blastopirellula marina]
MLLLKFSTHSIELRPKFIQLVSVLRIADQIGCFVRIVFQIKQLLQLRLGLLVVDVLPILGTYPFALRNGRMREKMFVQKLGSPRFVLVAFHQRLEASPLHHRWGLHAGEI